MRPVLGAATIVVAVIAIYAGSTQAYFFDDDFHWLTQTQSFDPARLIDLSLYNHFYRPVIETYFYAGLSLFGCDPFPFHVASIGIHLLTILAVFAFARTLGGSPAFAFLSALFFAVQPGMTDAVTWIGAITDQLPVLWYVLTLWLHLLFLQRGQAVLYVLSVVTFVLCHLTHESSATLLDMMLLVEFTFTARGSLSARIRAVAGHWVRYLPFGILLAAYLVLAYVVNTRSYLVQEGHYAFGLHALPNILNYIIWLYVGQRAPVDYAVMIGALVAMVVFGSARLRFSVVWIFITLAPVSFFTWENAPRYLYLPAVGFAMVVADLMLGVRALGARWISDRHARVVTAAVVLVLAARFAVFAKNAADSFPARAAHYERLAMEVRRANPGAVAGAAVVIDEAFLEGVPEQYREPAARIALCLPDLRLQMR